MFSVGQIRTALAVLLVSAFLVGCGTSGRVDVNATSSERDAYFVLRVTDSNGAEVSDGKIVDGEFKERSSSALHGDFALVAFLNATENGYIVGRVDAAHNTLALVMAHLQDGNRFMSCQGGPEAVVFAAPVGHVVYITDVSFTFAGRRSASGFEGRVYSSYKKDIESARMFLKSHYPNLADALEQGSFRVLPTDHAAAGFICGQ